MSAASCSGFSSAYAVSAERRAPDVARCVAGRITDAYSVEDLSAADPAQFQTDSFIQQVQGYVQECAPG